MEPQPEAGTGDVLSAPSTGESRWPPAVAVVVFVALNVAVHFWLPNEGGLRSPWLVPVIEGVLLVTLTAGYAGAPGKHTTARRRVGLALVLLCVAAGLWATGLLVYDLIKGSAITNSPGELLASGSMVWLGNNLVFALLYWLVDSGGPLSRARERPPLDFAFPQQISSELARPGWRPVFLDYLHLGFTNATAYSPTDVMPLTHRAKFAMVVQASVSLTLFALIVARAVNAFT